MERIILDRPLKDYSIPLGVYHVDFLCGDSSGAHLIRILREKGISYRFLNIPVDQWPVWKNKSEYRGN